MTPAGPNAWRRAAPLVMAHRGQRATVPEQTLEAYRAAIELGCEAIECDVQLTRDGRLVMLHDLTVDRTTDGHGLLADLTWDDVRRLDAGAWFGPEHAGARVPLLDEALDLAISAGIPLCIEIKGTPDDAPRVAAAVARVLRDRRLLDDMFISSFDHEALAVAMHEAGRALLAPERLPDVGPPDPAAAVEQATHVGAAVLQHRWEDIDADVVTALHDAGVAVWTWPVDSLEAIRRSVEVGADGMIGDDVVLLRDGLAQTGAASPRS